MTRRSGSSRWPAVVAVAVVLFSFPWCARAQADVSAPSAPDLALVAPIAHSPGPGSDNGSFQRTPRLAPDRYTPYTDQRSTWWPPRSEPRPAPPPRVCEPVTGAQALGWSVFATVVPTTVGAILLSEPPNSLFDARQALGGLLFAAGTTVGPSTGYFLGQLSARGTLSAGARIGGLALALREGQETGARVQRAAGVALLVGSTLWDIAHVAEDVDTRGNGWSLGITRTPGGDAPVLAARVEF